MNLQYLTKICFTICILCILLGAGLLLSMIWGEVFDKAFLWKAGLTLLVLFLASALTIKVSKTLDSSRSK